MIVAATGHREINEPPGVVSLKARVKLQYPSKTGKKAEVLICGMANGFDLLAASAAEEVGLEVWAIRPFKDHTVPSEWLELYNATLAYASKVEVLRKANTGPEVYHNRNRWMVDHSDVVMAYFNGGDSGGTYQCIKYAKTKGKPVSNIYLDPPF